MVEQKKAQDLKKTGGKVMVAGKEKALYEGPRGGLYVKKGGEFVRVEKRKQKGGEGYTCKMLFDEIKAKLTANGKEVATNTSKKFVDSISFGKDITTRYIAYINKQTYRYIVREISYNTTYLQIKMQAYKLGQSINTINTTKIVTEKLDLTECNKMEVREDAEGILIVYDKDGQYGLNRTRKQPAPPSPEALRALRKGYEDQDSQYYIDLHRL